VLVLLLGAALLPGVGASPAGADEVACGAEFPAYAPEPVATGSRSFTAEIPMSDGVVLRATVTLPTGIEGPFPVALTTTGYNRAAAGAIALGGGGAGLERHGYATVLLDDRGTGTSDGTWDSWGERTQADYPEVLDWIVAQEWSDGRIGLVGGSYMGITALFTAASGHPAVKAVFAMVPMADAYRDIVFAGGEINTAFIPLWMGLVTALSLAAGDPEPLVEHLLGVTEFQLPTVADALLGAGKDGDGPFWRQRSPIEVVDRIDVPVFIVGGLDDLFQRGEQMLYEALADHTDARLLMGPWTHGNVGSGLPAGSIPALDTLTLQWFDAHVRGLDTGAECIPPVTQYVVGADRWEHAPSWPRPNLGAERWHLRGDGSLTQEAPERAEAGRTYLQLPVTGLCTRSTNQWLIGLLGFTSCATDNRLDEALSLTWTSEPVTEAVRIDGPIQADLWIEAPLGGEAVASVAVSIVTPSGRSQGISNGLLRASQRAVDEDRSRFLDGEMIQPWHPFTAEASLPVPAGEPMLLPIEVFPTSFEIPEGHRLRITVAAYDVPHALPPLPAVLSTLAGPVTVLSSPEHPSSVVLPVVGAAVEEPTLPLEEATADEAPVDDERGTEVAAGALSRSEPTDAAAAAGAPMLPATGASVALPLAAVALAAGLALRTRLRPDR